MSHKSKQEAAVSDDESPIIGLDYKRRISKGVNCNGQGWKFYVSIKEQLPEWWAEFNGAVNHSDGKYSPNHMRSRYRDARAFALSKFKSSKYRKEREWFENMISPKKVWERNCLNRKRYEVPWLGDWVSRRRNGYWETDNKLQIRYLKDAIKENVNAAQAIRATSPFVVQSLTRLVRLQDKIDALFNGEPFIDDIPHSKVNQSRFKLYMSMHQAVEAAKEQIYDRWMKVHGVNPAKAEGMHALVQIAQSLNPQIAANALNPNFMPVNQDGKPDGSHILNLEGQGIVISPDALLLAEHLTKHAKTFRKPLPPIDEYKVIESEDIKEKDKNVKTN